MHGLLEHCLHASQDAKGGRIAVTKAKFKAWTKRGDIEADIIRIKERVQGCHLRFTVCIPSLHRGGLSTESPDISTLRFKIRLLHLPEWNIFLLFSGPSFWSSATNSNQG
jgi:hypothetical protein